MNVRFMSLGSGSSGNCYWLGTDQEAILIDAGIGFRDIRRTLAENNLQHIPIRALLITHDHTDHIRGASMVSASYGCPVYSTAEVHEGMDRNYGLQRKIPQASRRCLQRGEMQQLPCTPFQVTCFPVPHDSRDNVGYHIQVTDGPRFCLVTDCGFLTDDVCRYLSEAEHLVLESNHDVQMLMNGPYPYFLKKRVRGEGGHLSNDECAQALCRIWHPGIRHVFLCHLSQENNTPDLAYRSAMQAIRTQGADVGQDGVTLVALNRRSASQIYTLQGVPSTVPEQKIIPFF